MSGRKMTVAVGTVLAVVALAGCGGDDESASDTTDTLQTTGSPIAPGATLQASVGPGFDISLTTPDGEPVTTLAAGTYTIDVDDQSDIHNFHLTGSGVDEDSGVAESRTTTSRRSPSSRMRSRKAVVATDAPTTTS